MNQIENSTVKDINEILHLYQDAREYQYKKESVVWPNIPISMITQEIIDKHQWKLIINGKIAGIWATTFQDPLIWEDRNVDPSVYLHRIALNPDFRGQKIVKEIIEWSKIFAKSEEKQFIRLDTVGENQGLIKYYTSCGFDYLGMVNLKDTSSLPAHYAKAPVCLFQMSTE
ncbi:Acetyltransferase (GNAT) family protein [Marivirga sericea]|uniref:Acetyltransferase (GNAT) family protein n=1 Tax=Marivirga sericea TaxID=1028 RepID=A0A1X7JNA1_9BACT|nr:GNAT family N-acetyltransferase [Marivirga sericea]SMG29376.1 Acetyltransferase (GNAT) family protein [Marivirga sericea]